MFWKTLHSPPAHIPLAPSLRALWATRAPEGPRRASREQRTPRWPGPLTLLLGRGGARPGGQSLGPDVRNSNTQKGVPGRTREEPTPQEEGVDVGEELGQRDGPRWAPAEGGPQAHVPQQVTRPPNTPQPETPLHADLSSCPAAPTLTLTCPQIRHAHISPYHTVALRTRAHTHTHSHSHKRACQVMSVSSGHQPSADRDVSLAHPVPRTHGKGHTSSPLRGHTQSR